MNQQHCNIALKEWDAQIQALCQGQTSLLIRKGGIAETSEGFEITNNRFWLYPTFMHQNQTELRPEFMSFLRPDSSPGTIRIPALAEVQAVWKIHELPKALALESHQALNAAAIERKYNYKNKPWVHAILLKIQTLNPVQEIAETETYAGCVSWVRLEQNYSTENLQAVFTDTDMQKQKIQLMETLGQEGP